MGLLAVIGYASRAAEGKPPKDAAYQYSTAAGGLVQYAIILAVVLAIARPHWQLLALRRPSSYRRALTAALAAFVAVYVASAIVSAYSDPGREQGLTPESWDPHRAAAFVVNFAVFVAVAPVIEELTFRGLGYSLFAPLGPLTASLWIGIAFGLAHGLLEGLPILIVFGAALAFIRHRTGSVYPGMVVHALFNAIALIVAVTT
ncbi:MAG TPA: CPBP family intramembrane glutamic endopeptidase [Gaiellaceae bacterium]|nr:CPBP family intramembrane glutamic endopeptidase [Gaiellaceae bacterium]